MPKEVIRDLASVGYVPDAASASTPPNAWTHVRNWEFRTEGYPQVVNGYQNALLLKEDSNLSQNGTFLYPWTSINDDLALFYVGDNGEITLVEDDGANGITETVCHTASTPEDVAYDWQVTELNGVPIFSNGRDTPQKFPVSGGTDLINLPNWPQGTVASFMTSFNSQLVAAINGNQVFFSDVAVQPGESPLWSDPSEPSATSYNSVNEAGNVVQVAVDPDTTFSQVIDLSLFAEGDIVAMYDLNEVLYVFTTQAIIGIRYEGNRVYQGTVIHGDIGALTMNAVAVVPNGFFFLGPNQVAFINAGFNDNTGNTKVLLGEGTWKESLFNHFDEEEVDQIQCVYDQRSSSVFIHQAGNALLWRYNLDNQTMTAQDDHAEIRYLARSRDGIPNDPLEINELPSEWTIDTIPVESFDDFPALIRGQYANRMISIGGTTSPTIFVHDFGQNYNGRTISAVLQKNNILGTSQNLRGTTSLQRVVPLVDNFVENAELTVEVGKSKVSHVDPDFTQSRTINVDTQTKADFRNNTRYQSIRFTTNTSGMALHGYELDLTQQNRR